MTEDILPPPVWVDEQSSFQQLIAKLSAQSRIAVDTESNSLHAYRERVCLIQFSTPETDFLVDPFSIRDLSPLAPFFANPSIEKIFHAAEYDLICLKRDFDFKFANIFDTMQAARIIGGVAYRAKAAGEHGEPDRRLPAERSHLRRACLPERPGRPALRRLGDSGGLTPPLLVRWCYHPARGWRPRSTPSVGGRTITR